MLEDLQHFINSRYREAEYLDFKYNQAVDENNEESMSFYFVRAVQLRTTMKELAEIINWYSGNKNK